MAASPADLAPAWVTALFVALVVAMWALVVAGVSAAARRAGRPGRAAAITGGVLAAWLALTLALAAAGVFSDFAAMPPRMLLVLIVIIATVVWLARSRAIAPLLAATPPAWLIHAQVFRVAVEFVLWRLVVAGAAPELMSFTGRNFDIAVGLTAPVIAHACLVSRAWPRAVALWWNVAGFAVLVNTVVNGVLAVPTPLRMIVTEPPNSFVTVAPYIWLPAFLVTLAWSFHVLSIRQLRAGVGESSASGRARAARG
jgi:hypothetical protein